jgi:hypothetical protein
MSASEWDRPDGIIQMDPAVLVAYVRELRERPTGYVACLPVPERIKFVERMVAEDRDYQRRNNGYILFLAGTAIGCAVLFHIAAAIIEAFR